MPLPTLRPLALLVVPAFLAASIAAAHAHTAEDVSVLLLAKTQAFSDAGQAGDGAAMAKVLDPEVVFFNEGGDQASKADMASTTPTPAQTGVTTKMTIVDWACKVHGDVAMASFIDDQRQDVRGQPFHARYRSVETWLKEGGDWKMIDSETIALQDDPVAIALPARTLDDYAGTYASPTETKFTFKRVGDTLMASINGGPETAQKAEAPDVFFTPGRARFRKVFQRDAQGRVIAFAYRREGHDTVFKRTDA